MLSESDQVLVLGADGFIGRHLVRHLNALGKKVTAIGRVEGDFTDESLVDHLLSAAPKVDEIFHLITRQRTGAIQYSIQGELLAINARIHLNVLEAWRRHQPQAKLVTAGSSCVYPELDRPIPETAFLTGPLHDSVRGYGLAKQALIVGCETYAQQYGLTYLHCILATVYGPGDHKEENRSHFMTAMIDRAVREQRAGARKFTVWGAPNTTRDLLYIDDQIEAMLVANKVFKNRIVNCSSNQPITIGQAATATLKALDWATDIVYPEDTFRGAGYKSIDSSDFLQTTDWSPHVDILAGIKTTIAIDYQKC